MGRRGEAERTTRETRVRVAVDLDGSGRAQVATGMPFLDHLLEACARHGLLDLEVRAEGDLEVEGHHTAEDVGLVLGQAVAAALGGREGIGRYGWACLPMDEALVLAAVDLSGRPHLAWEVAAPARAFGAFHTELAPEFWRAFVRAAAVTLHVRSLAGENSHHLLEAVWKAVGRALAQAAARDPRVTGAPSTKGVL